MKTIILLPMVFALSLLNGLAQDPQFSQYYANQLYLNPAYAGNDYCPKASLNYRNQWPGLKGNFITSSFSYDKHFDEISGGIGLLVTHDKNGEGALSNTTVNLIYSYAAALSRNISLKAGFQAGYFQNTIKWNDLRFADMVDQRQGFVNSTRETNDNLMSAGIDLSSGLLLYGKKSFVGLSSHHLTEPQQSLYGYEEGRLRRKYTLHSGTNIDFKSIWGEIKISPNIMVHKQQQFLQVNAGCYLTKGPLVVGGWYRYKDAVILLIGLEHDNMKFGYSFDYTTSSLGFSGVLGSHELSFSYKMKCKVKSKKYRTALCPVF